MVLYFLNVTLLSIANFGCTENCSECVENISDYYEEDFYLDENGCCENCTLVAPFTCFSSENLTCGNITINVNKLFIIYCDNYNGTPQLRCSDRNTYLENENDPDNIACTTCPATATCDGRVATCKHPGGIFPNCLTMCAMNESIDTNGCICNSYTSNKTCRACPSGFTCNQALLTCGANVDNLSLLDLSKYSCVGGVLRCVPESKNYLAGANCSGCAAGFSCDGVSIRCGMIGVMSDETKRLGCKFGILRCRDSSKQLVGKLCNDCPKFATCDGFEAAKCKYGIEVPPYCKDKCQDNDLLPDCLCFGADFYSALASDSARCFRCNADFICNGSVAVFCGGVQVPYPEFLDDYVCKPYLLRCSSTNNYLDANNRCIACPSFYRCDGTSLVFCNTSTIDPNNVKELNCSPEGVMKCNNTSMFFILDNFSCVNCPSDSICDGSRVYSCMYGGSFPRCLPICTEDGYITDCVCRDNGQFVLTFEDETQKCTRCPQDFSCNSSTSVRCGQTMILNNLLLVQYRCIQQQIFCFDKYENHYLSPNQECLECPKDAICTGFALQNRCRYAGKFPNCTRVNKLIAFGIPGIVVAALCVVGAIFLIYHNRRTKKQMATRQKRRIQHFDEPPEPMGQSRIVQITSEIYAQGKFHNFKHKESSSQILDGCHI